MKAIVVSLAFLVSVTFCNVSFGQNIAEVDSLSQIISISKNDSLKVKALNKLAFHYIFSDASQAKSLLNKSEILALKSKLKFGYAEVLLNMGILNDVSGNSDSAKFFFTKSLKLAETNKFRNLQVRNTNNLGMTFMNTGNFQEALHYFLKALKINESLPINEQIKFDTLFNNIGFVYQQINLFNIALQYHDKAYSIRKAQNMLQQQAVSLNNIGICYNALGKLNLAVQTYQKGISIAKTVGDESTLNKILQNLGNSYQSLNRFDDAINCYKQVENNPNANPKTLLGVYSGLTAAYNMKGLPKLGLSTALKGKTILKQQPELRVFASHLYQYSAQSHYMLGNIGLGESDNAEFGTITQEVFSNELSEKIANYQIQYDTAKKEKLIAENNSKLLQNKLDLRQKSLYLIAFSIITLFTIIIGFLVYRQQRLKNNQLKQEHNLKIAIATIETQNKLQEQRLDISRDLHDNIGAQLTFIISSVENIKFAFDLKDSRLDTKLNTISNFAKATILELRDTIWAMNNEAILFEDLRARILNFIEKAKDASDTIAFKFVIDEQVSGTTLSSLAGMNVYRTIQEAVNNAIKYSEADEISIEVFCVDRKISISIVDNGIGFDMISIEKGNGLHNMQKRISDIEGILDIVSQPNIGTKLNISLPQSCVVNL